MQGKKVSDSSYETVFFPYPCMFNNTGTMHGVEIFKMIDDIGGAAAMRHSASQVVTASVSWLRYISSVYPGELLILKSSIHLVGRTSMEVGVRAEVENVCKNERRHVATCFLTYVAIDDEGRSREVPPLIVETEEEQHRQNQAEERRKLRTRG